MFSFLDNDFYTFSVAQLVYHNFPSVDVEYKFICRTKGVNLSEFKDEIEEKLELFCSSRITAEELTYLKTLSTLKADFLYFLEDLSLKRRFVHITTDNNGELEIRIHGPLIQTIWFEIPLLAIISEAYCKNQSNLETAINIGRKNLEKKINFFKKLKHPFLFADFGTRRRYSREWQEEVITTFKEKLPNYFTGTSNLDLARRLSLKEIGTQSHQFFQLGQGLNNVSLANSQRYMLEKWAKEYRGKLGIALTDTINLDSFLKDCDLYIANLYTGFRHDSGDPFIWGDKLINHLIKLGIDPMSKSLVFSDNLNFESASKINDYFSNRAKVSFGIGTNLTNDLDVKPLSIVIKLVKVNGNPVAKISDEPGKVICENKEFLNYLKSVYGLPIN